MMALARRSLRRLLILLGINLAIGAVAASVVYGYTGSQKSFRDQLQSAMQGLNGQRKRISDELAYIEINRNAYDTLIDDGLLAPQDRLAAADLLNRLSREHRLNEIHYSFDPQRSEPLGVPGRSDLVVAVTNVTIDITAISDIDLLGFVKAIMAHFPGDVRVAGLRVERRRAVDQHLLARLKRGDLVPVVEGQLEFQWRTLRRRDRFADREGER